MNEQLWKEVREILLEWEGDATEIHLLDIPGEQLSSLLDIVENALHESKLISSPGLPLDEPVLLQAAGRSKALAAAPTTDLAIQGSLLSENDVTLYLWFRPRPRTIDVEWIFWSDRSFPSSSNEHRHIETFQAFLGLATEIAQLKQPPARCLLSDEWNEDPRQLQPGQFVELGPFLKAV